MMMSTFSDLRLADGRRVRVAECGCADGVPVVFFQGTPSSCLLHPSEAVTRELGARMIQIDRPGFGGSDPSPGRTLVDWADDVAAVMDRLGVDRFLTGGISGGGPYVLATAWRWPERVMAAAVCGGSGPLELPGALAGAAPARRAGYLLARHAPWLFRRVIRWKAGPRVNADTFVREYTAHNPPADQAILADPTFRATYLANKQEALRQGPDAFADEVILGAKPWGFRLGDIRVPVHFWQGEADTSTPMGMARAMSAATPGSRLTVLPGQGHLFAYSGLWRAILADLLARRSARQQPVVP
jgi:pimeloyl-ACP methyl ester carboxylesterase